jgi:NitT/TauT family transport system ATP-binding protein
MHANPGRVVEVIEIPFPRPRQEALYPPPEFHALTDRIARVLHGH